MKRKRAAVACRASLSFFQGCPMLDGRERRLGSLAIFAAIRGAARHAFAFRLVARPPDVLRVIGFQLTARILPRPDGRRRDPDQNDKQHQHDSEAQPHIISWRAPLLRSSGKSSMRPNISWRGSSWRGKPSVCCGAIACLLIAS